MIYVLFCSIKQTKQRFFKTLPHDDKVLKKMIEFENKEEALMREREGVIS